jgi:hypothetical protein
MYSYVWFLEDSRGLAGAGKGILSRVNLEEQSLSQKLSPGPGAMVMRRCG